MKILDYLLSWLYPPRCAVCAEILPLMNGPVHFCADCHAKLPFITGPRCVLCGRAAGKAGVRCGMCRDTAPCFVRNAAVFPYDELVADALRRFKFHGHPEMGRALGALMADVCAAEFAGLVDVIVPVPLHRKRKWRRGYNQAAILADAVARETGLPLAVRCIKRVKATTPLFHLSPTARENTLKDAFAANPKYGLRGKRVLLVDDIFTTGSTLNACAKALKQAGAGDIYALTLAATLPKPKKEKTPAADVSDWF